MPDSVRTYARNAGVFEVVDPLQVRDGGVWKEPILGWAKHNGTWKICYADIDRELNIGAQSIQSFDFSAPYSTQTGFRLQSDGTARAERNPGTNEDITDQWKLVDYGRSYEFKWASVSSTGSGVFTTPNSENVWSPINTDRLWQLTSTDVGTATEVFDVFIREVGSVLVNGRDSGRITLLCDNIDNL